MALDIYGNPIQPPPETEVKTEETQKTENVTSGTETVTKDEKQDEIKYPAFFGDDFKIPERFEKPEEELNFYKNNYKKVLNYYGEEGFVNGIMEKYKDTLLSIDQNVDKTRAIMKALDENDPLTILKLYGADNLTKLGYDVTVSEKEKESYITREMEKLYGKNYIAAYKEDDAKNPETLSGKMLNTYQGLENQFDQHANKLKELQEKNKPPSEEDIKKGIEEQFKVFEKAGFSRQDYDQFISEVNKIRDNNSLTLEQLHYAIYHDDYVEDAYQRGIEEGKKQIGKEFQKIGGQQVKGVDKEYTRNEITKPNSAHEMYNSNPHYPGV